MIFNINNCWKLILVQQPFSFSFKQLPSFQNKIDITHPKSVCQVTSVNEHVCRVINNPNALHVVDDGSGRYSVLIPVNVNSQEPSEKNKFRCHDTDIDLTFGCLNTCAGMEYSLRIWNLIFTLETE